MMILTSRREPVIALDDFRYRGRPYQEGSYLDRRRCRMPQSKLNRMLRAKKVVMARDLTSDQLKKYGWVYDLKSLRTKLQKIKEPVTVKNQRIIDELIKKDETEEPLADLKPYIFDRGKDWYDVRQGEEILKKRVRKGTAEKFLAELEGGQNV